MPRVSKSTHRVTEIGVETQVRNEVKLLLRNRVRRQQDTLEAIRDYYDNLLLKLPANILNKPITQLTPDDFRKIKYESLEASTCEGNGELPRESQVKGKQQTRLAPSVKKNKYMTPMNLKEPSHHMGTVTPKFNPYAPMSVVRVPRDGEVAMSLTGSPLRVTSVITESKPNVVVPLENGRILSVLPERGLRMSQVPEIDETVYNQLKVLNDNLNTLLSETNRRKL